MLQPSAQGQGVEKALRAVLVWGATALGEEALGKKVEARHVVLGVGGGARGSQWLSWRRSALFTADGAFPYLQSHWR